MCPRVAVVDVHLLSMPALGQVPFMAAWGLKGLNPAAEKQVRYIDVPYDLGEVTEADKAKHATAIAKR